MCRGYHGPYRQAPAICSTEDCLPRYDKYMKMNSRLLLVSLFFLLPLLLLGATEPFRVAGTTNADKLRVRQEPTLTGAQVGSLAVETDLEILDVTPEEMVIGEMSARWYQIKPLPGGDAIEGWSYGYFIDVRLEDILALAIWNDQPLLVQELIDAGVDVNARLEEEGSVFTEYELYSYSSSPLMEATLAENEAALELLLAAGASPDTGYVQGEPGGVFTTNALVTAVERGNTAIVTALIQNDADLEIEMESFGGGGDGYRMSPLTAAVVAENIDLVELLLSSGADVNHALKYWAIFGDGDTWKTALDIAFENGLMAISFALEDAGGKTAETE